MIRALSTDAAVASLLIEYGDDSPAAIEALRQALVRRLDEIDSGTDDIAAHDDAIDLADALRGLGARSPPLEARVESALLLSQFADRMEDSPDFDDLDDLDRLDDLEDLDDVADEMVARPAHDRSRRIDLRVALVRLLARCSLLVYAPSAWTDR